MTDDLVKRAKSVYLSDENGPFIHELARSIEALTAEALDWRAQVGELSDRVKVLETENRRLCEIESAANQVRSLDEDEFEVIVGNCAYYNLRATLSQD